MHFGYRVAGEMLAYLEQAGRELTPEVADFLLTSKVLPKLRGTEHHLRTPLEALEKLTADGGYTRSHAKVTHMLDQLRIAGFASFF